MFEGQQLEKLFDFLEEKLSSIVKHKNCLSAASDIPQVYTHNTLWMHTLILMCLHCIGL